MEDDQLQRHQPYLSLLKRRRMLYAHAPFMLIHTRDMLTQEVPPAELKDSRSPMC